MKTLLIIALLSCGFCASIKSQEYTTPNVLSYYAMGNSIDGQPMIEMANVLRFYPVFALRAFTDAVIVTVYYGPYVYTDTARSMGDKHYWEARLPRFELGEAIQRIDVKTSVNLSEHPLIKALGKLQSSIKELESKIDLQIPELSSTNLLNDIDKRNLLMKNIIEKATIKFSYSGIDKIEIIQCELEKICKKIQSGEFCIDDSLRTLLRTTLKDIKSALTNKIENVNFSQQYIINTINNYITNSLCNDIQLSINDIPKEISNHLSNNAHTIGTSIKNTIEKTADILGEQDSIRTLIASESIERITDTNYTGPSIKKGDVIFLDSYYQRVQILYRNHKTSLRQLPALDPVESMGLFRIRYIPFVIAGENLMTTFTGDNSAVFEIGLAFGDVRVSGDDFVKPELSIRRLGVAFAITNRLFGNDARVRALALTYDFNSYGSIAAGVNFPGKDVASGTINESYISFGINKRAFEQLLKGLTGLF